MDRRRFITHAVTTGTGIAAVSAHARPSDAPIRIVGVSCSPRPGKTTATSVKVALEAAAEVDDCIKTELIDLGGMDIGGWSGGAKPGEAALPDDDFNLILPRFKEPVPHGLIIGSPTYFRSMSALCKAFLERLAVLRKPELLLADKPVGVLAVGAYRNGGQELVINQVLTAMLCHEAVPVGGKPSAHQGGTLWNAWNDDIMKDEFGIASAKKVGQRVAQAAIKLA